MGPQVRQVRHVQQVRQIQQIRQVQQVENLHRPGHGLQSSIVRRRPVVTSAVCAIVVLAGAAGRPALASGPAEYGLDATALTTMEQRAAAAEPRERCYLYSELLQGWTELAGRSMASGNDSEAAKAMEHADADVAQLKSTLSNDSKRLKNAELLLEHTAHHLTDMVRVASMEQHDAMQSVLKHLNNVHDALLAQIFAH